ncbi:hypothetical protein [Allosphingosinicella sp.]|uniref:hypothetical protein n=1 Tax=Allosphingosinicella sp. TaxID=2823234 RepID=UPI00378312A9
MAMTPLRKAQLRRYVRLSGGAAWKCFREPIFNHSQALQLLLGLVGTWLILQTATPAEAARQVSAWLHGAQAFGIVLAVWAGYSLLSAPFAAYRAEKAKGVWRGNNFAYHHPQHVFTRQFFANGLTNAEIVRFPDAEKDSFVRYSIEFEPPVINRVSATVSMGPGQLQDPAEIRIGGRGGVRISEKREAWLLVRLMTGTVPVICRVYCHSFSVGADEFMELDAVQSGMGMG